VRTRLGARDRARRSEAHPGCITFVQHDRGPVASGKSLADLVHATFPAASITGAPKPRVMQAIEDLEPVRRGVYCARSAGSMSTSRPPSSQVAIRTFTITHAYTDLGVGGAVVADSTRHPSGPRPSSRPRTCSRRPVRLPPAPMTDRL